jgi:predicted DCC family thiol-disulfide oxidoreductase YuxK
MVRGMRASAVILFDGVCNLCNASVAFVIRRDRRQVFRFAPLQSATAQRLLGAHELPEAGGAPAGKDDWQSVIVIEDGRVFHRSAAALRILRGLGLPWSLLSVFVIVPAPIRDWLYDVVARHRYRWFGKRDTCAIPTPDQRARFLE